MSYVLNQGLGDITCWGVDVDQWDIYNQVGLRFDLMNVFVFKVASSAKALSSSSAKDLVSSLMKSTFFPGADIQIFSTQESAQPPASNSGSFLVTSDSTTPKLGWKSGGSIYVTVKFTAKEGRVSFPWPRIDTDAYVGKGCPKEVTVGLYAVDHQVAIPHGAMPEDGSPRSGVLSMGVGGRSALPLILVVGLGAALIYGYRKSRKG